MNAQLGIKPIVTLTTALAVALGMVLFLVLNFALARDVSFDAETILDIFDPAHFAAKLTPVNPTARGKKNGFETVLRSDVDWTLKKACDALTTRGFDVVLSVGDEREDMVGSNCGQAVRIERGSHSVGPFTKTA